MQKLVAVVLSSIVLPWAFAIPLFTPQQPLTLQQVTTFTEDPEGMYDERQDEMEALLERYAPVIKLS